MVYEDHIFIAEYDVTLTQIFFNKKVFFITEEEERKKLNTNANFEMCVLNTCSSKEESMKCVFEAIEYIFIKRENSKLILRDESNCKSCELELLT